MNSVAAPPAPDYSPVIVLLAAGESRRFGAIKQLAPIDGEPMVRRAARTALGTGASVVVIIGAHADVVGQALADLPVHLCLHDDWAAGMGSSLAAGIHEVGTRFPHASAALVCLADQPLMTARLLTDMLARHRQADDRVLATAYGGNAGVPALFPRDCFASLLQLSGAEGARARLRQMAARVELFPDSAGPDVDTPADLQAGFASLPARD